MNKRKTQPLPQKSQKNRHRIAEKSQKILWCAEKSQRFRVFKLGARLRGRKATQRSKKGSEKVMGRVLREGFSEGFLWVLQ